MGIKNIQTAHLIHDLKNPVSIIETSARSVLDKQANQGYLNPKQEKAIRRILRNALKIKNLTNSMLELDRAALGFVNPTDCTLFGILKTALIEVFDLISPEVSDTLDQITDVQFLTRILKEHGVVLEADESLLTKNLHLDDTKLTLVVINLLSNAFKYRERFIFLKCSTVENTIALSVADDGPGIPEHYHQQVFEQYFQCTEVEDFPTRGHGLGLAGALALTQAMGGNLTLRRGSNGAEFLIQIKEM